MAENILIAILGGGNLLLFIKFLIERHDAKKAKADNSIKDKLTILEKDGIRTQLLMLILMQPEEQTEILTIAEHYFKKPADGGLGGNWYMTGLFKAWCEQRGLEPDWFEA